MDKEITLVFKMEFKLKSKHSLENNKTIQNKSKQRSLTPNQIQT